jgi:hypothetical protein
MHPTFRLPPAASSRNRRRKYQPAALGEPRYVAGRARADRARHECFAKWGRAAYHGRFVRLAGRIARGAVLWNQIEIVVTACLADPKQDDRQLGWRARSRVVFLGDGMIAERRWPVRAVAREIAHRVQLKPLIHGGM